MSPYLISLLASRPIHSSELQTWHSPSILFPFLEVLLVLDKATDVVELEGHGDSRACGGGRVEIKITTSCVVGARSSDSSVDFDVCDSSDETDGEARSYASGAPGLKHLEGRLAAGGVGGDDLICPSVVPREINSKNAGSSIHHEEELDEVHVLS